MYVRQFDRDGNADRFIYCGHQFVRSIPLREGFAWWAVAEIWPNDAGFCAARRRFPPVGWRDLHPSERPVYEPYGYFAGGELVLLRIY